LCDGRLSCSFKFLTSKFTRAYSLGPRHIRALKSQQSAFHKNIKYCKYDICGIWLPDYPRYHRIRRYGTTFTDISDCTKYLLNSLLKCEYCWIVMDLTCPLTFKHILILYLFFIQRLNILLSITLFENAIQIL